jgi:hypothetical protein
MASVWVVLFPSKYERTASLLLVLSWDYKYLLAKIQTGHLTSQQDVAWCRYEADVQVSWSRSRAPLLRDPLAKISLGIVSQLALF